MSETSLPDVEENGRSGEWAVTDQSGQAHVITGQFLGMGTSFRPVHKNHPTGLHAPKGVHCSTCRWTEIRIFRGYDGTLYIVRSGVSDVPGERDLVRVIRVSTPFELVENLTTTDRRAPSVLTLPFAARHALAQAASHDGPLRDAYINSPVTRS